MRAPTLTPLMKTHPELPGSDMRARCWRLEGDASRSCVMVGQAPDESSSFDERLLPSGCRVLREMQPQHATAAAAPTHSFAHAATPLGINSGCTAAITSAAFCGGVNSGADAGLMLLGSLDGTIRAWSASN